MLQEQSPYTQKVIFQVHGSFQNVDVEWDKMSMANAAK